MKGDWRVVLRGTARFLAMAAASAVVGCIVRHQVLHGGDPSEAANENALIEFIQLALLVASSALAAFTAAKFREGREGVALVAAFFLCMAIRECDSIFDHLLCHGAWFPIALAVAIAAIAWAARSPKRMAAGLSAIATGPDAGILYSGLSVILVFSRLLGLKSIWLTIYRDVCGEEQADTLSRAMKNIAEEGTELFGYALIAFWAILFAASRANRRSGGR